MKTFAKNRTKATQQLANHEVLLRTAQDAYAKQLQSRQHEDETIFEQMGVHNTRDRSIDNCKSHLA